MDERCQAALLQHTQDIVDKSKSIQELKKLVETHNIDHKALARYLWTDLARLNSLLLGDMEVYSHTRILYYIGQVQDAVENKVKMT